jgi:hypothetical protein
VDEEVAAGMRLMKIPEDQIQQALAKAAAEKDAPEFDFEVYEDCWRSVKLFERVGTQWTWRVRAKPHGFGAAMWSVRAGLNYHAVESALRMGGVKRGEWAQLFDDLVVMERAVLRAEAEQ